MFCLAFFAFSCGTAARSRNEMLSDCIVRFSMGAKFDGVATEGDIKFLQERLHRAPHKL